MNVKVLVIQSHLTLCDPMYCYLPGSSVHGILQASILGWVAPPFSRGSSCPKDWTWVSRITGRFFTIWATRGAPILYMKVKVKVLVTQSCLTLCDSMHCSLPGSSVHGIFQAKILEWFAVSFSRGSSGPRGWTWVICTAGRFFTIWATREAQFYT